MNHFITSIAYYPDQTDFHKSSRCFGYFAALGEAVEAVKRNSCNMHESLYNYLVIEAFNEGIHPEVVQEYWYVWSDFAHRWEGIYKPQFTLGTINWAIG